MTLDVVLNLHLSENYHGHSSGRQTRLPVVLRAAFTLVTTSVALSTQVALVAFLIGPTLDEQFGTTVTFVLSVTLINMNNFFR